MATRDPEPEDLDVARPDEPVRGLPGVGVRDLIGAGGRLAALDPHHEERPTQLQMAELVARSFAETKHAVVEAGTGTGKTLAYLAPVVLHGRRTVVSTATKALQEQLVDKDLPLLQKLGARFRFAVMKGRGNYLCKLRYEMFCASPSFVSREEQGRFVRLKLWAQETQTGDRAELDLPDAYVAWRDVSSTAETCVGQECTHFESCHVTRMRQRAQEADIIVVNHHLFFADLALRNSAAAKAGVEIVPRAEAIVFDEAHNLEEVATEFFGVQSSNYRFFDFCRDVDRAVESHGNWPRSKLLDATAALGAQVDHFFKGVAALAPADQGPRGKPAAPAPVLTLVRDPEPGPDLFAKPKADAPREISASIDEILSRAKIEKPAEGGGRETRWTLAPGALDPLAPQLQGLVAELDELARFFGEVQKERDEKDAELDGFVRRCDEMKAALEIVAGPHQAKLVYWAEVRGRGVFLRATPVDVAETLRNNLFSQQIPIVMTSATLATGGETTFFRRRVGLPPPNDAEGRTLDAVLASPFDYSTQAALYLPRHLPEPNDETFLEKASDDVAALIALAKGRTFVLCTSLRAMNEIHRRLAPRIPYRVLRQGDKPKGQIIREFREEPSVLFATQSFWEGVDIQGDALSMVIIDKLPFASPTDPLVAARMRSIEERGGTPFGEYQLPSAAITLKQGFGRLIRSQRDTGAVAILDRRLWTKGYGGYLRKSLPGCPTFDRFADLKLWWRERRRHEGE